jgi:signal transduction histidine kinase
MPPPWAADSSWSERAAGDRGAGGRRDGPGGPDHWPGGGMPRAVRLWLPVVVSFLAQVPPVAFLAWRSIDRRVLDHPGGFGADPRSQQIVLLAVLLPVLLALVGPLALIGARRFPGPVVAVTAVAAAALLLVRPDIGTPNIALGFAIALGIIRGARVWVYVSVGTVWAGAVAIASLTGISVHPLRGAATTLALAVVMGIGEAIRSRRERFLEFRRTADQRRMTAEQRERVRIARELHDVLAHSLSQINVQAGVGLHLIDSQPEKAAEALANIKSASKNALDEVRAVLGILRSDPAEGSADASTRGSADASAAPLTPQPDLAELPALIDSFRAQGLDVTYVNALEAESAAPAATQLALFRICQEALTNVLRHAEATGASVYLGVDRNAYLLTITDDGTAQADRSIEPGGGLLGMRERAELLGGSLHTVRAANGGFRVEARIPLSFGRTSHGERGNG